MIALLPCPICNKHRDITIFRVPGNKDFSQYYICERCGFRSSELYATPCVDMELLTDETRKIWNESVERFKRRKEME